MSSPPRQTAPQHGRPPKPTKGAGIHGPVKKSIPKKDGAGTYGAWGRPGIDDLKATGTLGPQDPVFDEEDPSGTILEVIDVAAQRAEEALKKDILQLLNEYIEEGDLQETLTTLKVKNNIPAAEFIKRALIFGIERRPAERELISRLLSNAHPLFEGKGYEEAFQALLYRLPDLVIDVPDSADYIGLFLARALYDECLPPAFLKTAIVDNEYAKQAIALAYNTYSSPTERRRLDQIWGASLDTVEDLENAVKSSLREYFETFELSECTRAIQELNVPSYRGQIVCRAIVLALERDTSQARTLVVELLSNWFSSGFLSDFYLRSIDDPRRSELDDLVIDVPTARQNFDAILELMKERGLPLGDRTADASSEL